MVKAKKQRKIKDVDWEAIESLLAKTADGAVDLNDSDAVTKAIFALGEKGE